MCDFDNKRYHWVLLILDNKIIYLKNIANPPPFVKSWLPLSKLDGHKQIDALGKIRATQLQRTVYHSSGKFPPQKQILTHTKHATTAARPLSKPHRDLLPPVQPLPVIVFISSSTHVYDQQWRI